MYPCFYAIFKAGKSIFLLFITHAFFWCYLLDLEPCVKSLTFLSFCPVTWISLLCTLRMVTISCNRDFPGVYGFDEISTAKLGFEKFFRSFEVLFFPCISSCLTVTTSSILKVPELFLPFKYSTYFLIWWFYFFRCFSFSLHYEYVGFFNTEFHS